MTKPIALTVAGSDTCGGAGIQADLKTMHALGVHGCSVIAALTAQNTIGVTRIEYPSEVMLRAQFAAIRKDIHSSAVKIGMLGTESVVRTTAEYLRGFGGYVLCDPVMVSSTGQNLLEERARATLVERLLPLVDLLTPNIPEAETFLGRRIEDPDGVEKAADELLDFGVKSVLIKGGHLEGSLCLDYWTDGARKRWLSGHRRDVQDAHGTGCTLSSAIVSCRALGLDELDAVVVAKAYVSQGMRNPMRIGHGRRLLAHQGWPACPEDMPWITDTAQAASRLPSFPACETGHLGLYPIVTRKEMLERLLPLGVETVQVRIKDMQGDALEQEVAESIAYARAYGARLYINDHWQLALKYGAYGVHLGQDDLEHVDVEALAREGIRLGVSTHSYAELARAWGVRPTYVALGTLFHTTSKHMDYEPLGLEAFARMRRLVPVPVVAIGGITLERAADVFAAGADGCAVVSDISASGDIRARVRGWQEALQEVHTPADRPQQGDCSAPAASH